MDLTKLAPWNWFKKEQEHEQETQALPAPRQERSAYTDHPVMRVHNEIDRLFENAFRGFGLPSLRVGGDLFPGLRTDWLKPTLDLSAADTEYTVSVELPGVEASEVKLELVNDTLKVSGEKRREKEEKDKDFYRMERSYGSFQRVLSLPEDADQDGIKAVFKNGVMTVTIPRKSPPKSEVKQIAVTPT